MTSHGTVCPFCTTADPKWPERYMQPITPKGHPSVRYRNLVKVTCLDCGATWTRETGEWKRPETRAP